MLISRQADKPYIICPHNNVLLIVRNKYNMMSLNRRAMGNNTGDCTQPIVSASRRGKTSATGSRAMSENAEWGLCRAGNCRKTMKQWLIKGAKHLDAVLSLSHIIDKGLLN